MNLFSRAPIITADPYRMFENGSARATIVNPTRMPTQVFPRLVDGQSTRVVLDLGQSTALSCNYVGTALDTPFAPVNSDIDAFNIVNGGIYTAGDTMLGGEGSLGSVGIRVYDELRTRAWADRIIPVGIAWGGYPIAVWADRNLLGNDIDVACRRLSSVGLTVDMVLITIGESDAGAATAQAVFAADHASVIAHIRECWPGVPIIVTPSTYPHVGAAADAIIAGTLSQVDEPNGIYEGPDANSITDRVAGLNVHFTQSGADDVAVLYADVMEPL